MRNNNNLFDDINNSYNNSYYEATDLDNSHLPSLPYDCQTSGSIASRQHHYKPYLQVIIITL